MITPAQRRDIEACAYVPEHLPRYVAAITAAQPHLLDDYVVYTAGERLIFVGYPLHGSPAAHSGSAAVGAGRVHDDRRGLKSPAGGAAWRAALDAAIARFRPGLIAVTAPALPADLAGRAVAPPDAYYRLDLAATRPDKKLRNLLRRADRALTVRPAARFGPEHARLVAAFLADTPVDEGTRFIFERIDRYAGAQTGLAAMAGWVRRATDRLRRQGWQSVSPSRAAPLRSGEDGAPLILEARDTADRLIAFDIAAFGGEYAFYLFNFRARDCYAPGASDLLLARLIALAQDAGARYLNLGLGINSGVTHFKEKWGATPFLTHMTCTWERPRAAWEAMLAQ